MQNVSQAKESWMHDQKNIAAESLKRQGMPFSPYNSSNLVRTASSLDTAILEKCYQCHLSIELRRFNFLQ